MWIKTLNGYFRTEVFSEYLLEINTGPQFDMIKLKVIYILIWFDQIALLKHL